MPVYKNLTSMNNKGLLATNKIDFSSYGCGNNVHIKCMKVWADHQKSNGETQLKCPLCREQFSTFELLDQEYRTNSLNKLEKLDLHYGLVCKSCKSTPIAGKIYKCTECTEFYLCQSCFNTDFHDKHSFVFREVLVVFVLINFNEYCERLFFYL